MNQLTTADRELEIMRNLMEDRDIRPAEALVKEGLIAADAEVSSKPYELEQEGFGMWDGKVKDYQSYENARNKKSTKLFEDMIQAAFGESASKVLIAHHLNFEHDSDIGTINEIPSADTLIFDHDIMTRIFGKDLALKHMMLLATVPVDKRDRVLEVIFRAR